MTRSPAARLSALVLALVAGLGPATLALAHGHAHEHLVEAQVAGHVHDHGTPAEHHAPVAGDESRHDGVTGGPTVRASHGGGDHAHPRLAASSVTARSDVRLDASDSTLPPPAPAVAPPAAPPAAVWLLTAAPPRAGPAATPPPSRAPPLG